MYVINGEVMGQVHLLKGAGDGGLWVWNLD